MNYMPYGAPYPTYMPQRTDMLMGAQNAPQPPQSYGQANTQPPAQAGFQCRPVTSREEAVAAQTDYFSPGTLMPDLGHGMVYFKRFNQNTGASDFYEFAVVQHAAEAQETAQYPDYSEALASLGVQLSAMSERIDGLCEKLDDLRPKTTQKGGRRNDRQYAADYDPDDAVGA